jgi:hypothetical protein
MDEGQWRKLCALVATEPDPERLSELVDQLLKELDARRETLGDCERAPGPTLSDA